MITRLIYSTEPLNWLDVNDLSALQATSIKSPEYPLYPLDSQSDFKNRFYGTFKLLNHDELTCVMVDSVQFYMSHFKGDPTIYIVLLFDEPTLVHGLSRDGSDRPRTVESLMLVLNNVYAHEQDATQAVERWSQFDNQRVVIEAKNGLTY